MASRPLPSHQPATALTSFHDCLLWRDCALDDVDGGYHGGVQPDVPVGRRWLWVHGSAGRFVSASALRIIDCWCRLGDLGLGREHSELQTHAMIRRHASHRIATASDSGSRFSPRYHIMVPT